MKLQDGEKGFSLVETMIAAAIAGIAFVGTMGAVEIASRYIAQSNLADQALATVHARMEGKRSVRWRMILDDDLDHDGQSDVFMKDDGEGPDATAGDGVYTATAEDHRMTEVWTAEVDRSGPLASVGLVILKSVVVYDGPNGHREVRLQTIRANPAYLGNRPTQGT